MSNSKSAPTTVSVALGASILLVVSADAAASVVNASSDDVLSIIRASVKSGDSNLGQARTDELGRLQLSQFNDAWNKWKKEFSDARPG